MSARTLDQARLQSLRAEALERWLVCTGWRREFHDPAEFSQYIKYDREPHAPDDEPHVVDVLHRRYRDYAARMRDALATLETVERRPAEEILRDLETPPEESPESSLDALRETLRHHPQWAELVGLVDRLEEALGTSPSSAGQTAHYLIDQVCRHTVGGYADDGIPTARLVIEALQRVAVPTSPEADPRRALSATLRNTQTWLADLERLVNQGVVPDTPEPASRNARLVQAVQRFVSALRTADRAKGHEAVTASGASAELEARFDDALDQEEEPVQIGEYQYRASEVLKQVDPEAYRERFFEYFSRLGRSQRPDEVEESAGSGP